MRCLLSFLLVGCVVPIQDLEHQATLDVDRDGHLPPAAGGLDCDDTNPAVHPDAQEWCNGLDDNCDGVVDPAEARGLRPSWADTDGDDAGDPATLMWSCDRGERVENDRDCDDSDANLTPKDQDGDGFSGCDGDCDDSNSLAWPGAPEWCGDGFDNDCSGAEDDDAIDVLPWFHDADNDGTGGSVVAWACNPPNGHVSTEGDCDDTDNTVFPGATETCNLVDDDCDSLIDEDASDATWWYDDADGDGHGDVSTATLGCSGDLLTAGDCDDSDDTLHPGATEVCGDGLDNDCDRSGCGLPAGNLLDVDGQTHITGIGELGTALAVGDLTGDGVSDLLLGAPGNGATHLFAGPIGAGNWNTTDAVSTIFDLDLDGSAGQTLLVSDVTSDGQKDLIVAAPWSGAPAQAVGVVTVLAGPIVPGMGDLNGAVATLAGLEPDGRFGWTLAQGALHSDGLPDLVVSAPTGADGGVVHVFETPLPVLSDTSTATTTLFGPGAGDGFGTALHLGDFSGDGIPDLAVGAPDTTNGDVWLFNGPLPMGSLTGADATAHLTGAAVDAALGSAIASGDLNGDGALDLVIAAPGDGRIHIVYGPWFPIDADVSTTLGAERSGVLSVSTTVACGDLNGDGFDDLVVGDPEADIGGTDRGAAWVFYGPVTGTGSLDDAHARITGGTDTQGLGAAALLEDLTGNGDSDLLLGGPASGVGATAVPTTTMFRGTTL